jgi:hypothetical protein
MTDEQYQATPKHVLEHQIMSPGEGKNEREWWACHEIEKLRARIAVLEAALKPFADKATVYPDLPDNWLAHVTMKHLRAARAAYLGEAE